MLELLKAFFKIGLIGFGGGSALIPVIEKEVVIDKNFVSPETYTEETIIANITPGALPVKLCAAIGNEQKGAIGGILGAFAVALPGVMATAIFVSLMSKLNSEAISIIEYASVGISCFIIVLLLHYISKVISTSKSNEQKTASIVIMFISAVLTFGKEIRNLLYEMLPGFQEGSLGTPILDISTINLLILAFFLIFTLRGSLKLKGATTNQKVLKISSLAIAVLYVITSGKGTGFNAPLLTRMLPYIMLILAGFCVYQDVKSGSAAPKAFKVKSLIFSIAPFIILIVLFSIIIEAKYGFAAYTIDYIKYGVISSFTSFGGGEAYLTVAQGLFVDSGMVETKVFYSQILPIANALPGPILVKILSAVGYVIGFNITDGSMFAGYSFSILGLIIGVGVSCTAYFLIEAIYKAFSDIKVFSLLKVWILPVICGMLITTMLSMFSEMIKIINHSGKGGLMSIGILAGIFALIYVLQKKFKLFDVFIILISGALSVAVLLL